MIRGGGNDARPTLVAKAIAPRAPTSPESLRAASKYITVKELGHPSGIRAVNAPDPRFNGRQVYTVAIQMPNITSYVGSWLMWYADRNEVPPNAPPISPPIPHHKVDPKYVATAIEERVEGTIRLACIVDKAGKVVDVELVRGLDDRLNESALEALAKWEFGPAMRAGIPVDVEVLVEIPFRLAPRAAR
jgi:TonB family protein